MSLRFFRLVRVALLGCVLWLGLSSALGVRQVWAATEVLVLVGTKGTADPSPYELRLRSELRAEGLDALLVTAGSTDDESRNLARRLGASGTIEITLGEEEAIAAVWVGSVDSSLEVNRSIKVSLSQRDAVTVLALRAVNLYVGAQLELEQQRRSRAEQQKADRATSQATGRDASGAAGVVVAPPEPKDSHEQETGAIAKKGDLAAESSPEREASQRAWASNLRRFRLGGGVSLMQFTDRLDRRIAPVVEFVATLAGSFRLGVTAAGPYLGTLFVSTPTDSGVATTRVTVDQEFVWLDGRYRLALARQFELEPSLGLGVARYGVSGDTSAEYAGRDAQTASLVTSLGGTLVWRVTSSVSLLAGVDGLFRWQTPKVVVNSRDLTGTSRVNLFGYFGPAWAF